LGQSAATTTASTLKRKMTWDDDPYYLVSFSIHKSRRYHAKMSAAYQGLNDFVLSANAVVGASAFVSLIGGKNTLVAQILIGFVAVASAVDRVFGFSKKSKKHYDLCRKFTELASSLENWEATEVNLKKARSRRVKIESDEPPVKRLIDIVARNEELRSRGYAAEHFAPISRLQGIFGYFVTFGMRRLNKWRDENVRASSTTVVGRTESGQPPTNS
jgi:hypothetical protein